LGVRRIYGYPGDVIKGVIGALQRADNMEFIQVRHEEMAAFMAVAHAKFTGRTGSLLVHGEGNARARRPLLQSQDRRAT
jgi:pyruvate dehydrogenase (quinone)